MRRALLLLLLSAVFAISARAEDSRHFTFRYEFTVRNITPGERVRVWIPLAHSDQFQAVKVVSSTGDLPLKKTTEREYGNEMLYAAEEKASKAEYHFTVEYDVVRNERVVPLSGTPHLAAAKLSERERQRFLEPDRLVPVTGLPAEIAAKEVVGRSTDLERARALYEYVFRTMKYDKSGTGWAAETRYGPAIPSAATALTSTPCSFPWRARKRSRRATRWGFPSPRTNTPARSPDITAGPTSI